MRFPKCVFFAREIAKLGFFLTSLSSALFLILTIFYVKEKVGSYRYLLMVLPIIGFLFALFEYLVDPFFHSYNGGFAYFRLTSFEGFSLDFNHYALAAYVALYGSTISVLALQFVYRYWAVFRPRCIRTFFDGPRFVFPLLYIIAFCFLFFINDLIFNRLDDYSTEYLEKEIYESYGTNLTKNAAFVLVAYDKDGSIRIKQSVGLISMSQMLTAQYAIIIYCAVVMTLKMQEKLSTLSEKLQKVHRQFYYALVFQITTPTLTLFFPVFVLFFVPYLNLEFSFPTGTILSSFALYPAMDILIMIYISSYYNEALKELLKTLSPCFGWKKKTQSHSNVHSTMATTVSSKVVPASAVSN